MMKYLAFLIPFIFSTAHGLELKGLTQMDGTPAKIDTAKAKLLVVFWATWCDECRAKLRTGLPEINSRKDVGVITVNTDKDEGRAKEFIAKENVALPVLRDPNKELRKELKVFSVPHWAVFKKNKDGNYELVKSEPAFDFDHVTQALGGGS